MYEVGDKVIYQGADKSAYKKVGILKSIEEKDGKPQLTVEFEGGETFTAPVDDWSKEFTNAARNALGFEPQITDAQWKEAYKWFEANGYKVHASDEGGFSFTKPIMGKQFYNEKDGWNLYKKLSRNAVMNLKFKVGDKVKVVGSGLQSKGKIGEITRANPEYKGWPYKVRFINNPNGSVGEYAEAELMKATREEVEKAKKHTWNAKFKVGDKVTDGSGVYLVTGIDNGFGSYEWKLVSGRGDSSHSEGGDFDWADSKMKIVNAATNAKFKVGDKVIVDEKEAVYGGLHGKVTAVDGSGYVGVKITDKNKYNADFVRAKESLLRLANSCISTNSVVRNAMAANRRVARNGESEQREIVEMNIDSLKKDLDKVVRGLDETKRWMGKYGDNRIASIDKAKGAVVQAIQQLKY